MGEDIYKNDSILERTSKETQDLKPAAAVVSRPWRCHSTTAALCPRLLCLLLLAGVIGLAVGNQNATDETIKTDQLMTEKKQLRAERDQLKAERDQLKAERDQLREERDQLRAERDQLREERDQPRTERGQLKTERDQPKTERGQLKTERDYLKRHHCESNSGWRWMGSSCYIVSNVPKTWQDGRADCISKGGDLVIINSQEKEEFFFNLATSHLWFGMTDKVHEGTWIWVDGTPVTTTYWEPVEPNNGGGRVGEEDCAFISRIWTPNNTNPLHGWFDYGCGRLLKYICERAI